MPCDSQMDLASRSTLLLPCWATSGMSLLLAKPPFPQPSRGFKKKPLFPGDAEIQDRQHAVGTELLPFPPRLLTLKCLPLHNQRKHWKICHCNGQIPALLRREAQIFHHRIKNKSGYGMGIPENGQYCKRALSKCSAQKGKRERKRERFGVLLRRLRVDFFF